MKYKPWNMPVGYALCFVQVSFTHILQRNLTSIGTIIWEPVKLPWTMWVNCTTEMKKKDMNKQNQNKRQEKKCEDVLLCTGSKVHGANMGPIWGQQDPGGPMLAAWTLLSGMYWRWVVLLCFVMYIQFWNKVNTNFNAIFNIICENSAMDNVKGKGMGGWVFYLKYSMMVKCAYLLCDVHFNHVAGMFFVISC